MIRSDKKTDLISESTLKFDDPFLIGAFDLLDLFLVALLRAVDPNANALLGEILRSVEVRLVLLPATALLHHRSLRPLSFRRITIPSNKPY